jgi:hypothetical protein
MRRMPRLPAQLTSRTRLAAIWPWPSRRIVDGMREGLIGKCVSRIATRATSFRNGNDASGSNGGSKKNHDVIFCAAHDRERCVEKLASSVVGSCGDRLCVCGVRCLGAGAA